MKWWGWGDPNISFPMHDKPILWPWIKQKVGLTGDAPTALPVTAGSIVLPEPRHDSRFVAGLAAVLAPDQIRADDDARIECSYGKSYPNLWRARRGDLGRSPDLIVLPRCHDDVVKVIALANAHDVCVVPFGGGTNIVGGVDPKDQARMVISLDMRQMNRLLKLDPYSMTATIEAGALGPKLEKDLQAQGFSLGHYPDSFEYSTLGGWIATRSAGMQSDEYGKIEDMLVAVKMVTPAGTIETRNIPASSAGPDLNRLVCGSEGVLGVITEATMRVHPNPELKDYRGFLFKSFGEGVAAIHECLERGFVPSMIRLQDSGETELALHMKTPKKGVAAWIEKPVKAYLKRAGYNAPCVMVVGFEGYAKTIAATRDHALRIFKKHKGFPLGPSVGKTWSKDKFNIPYLRDYVMDHGVMCDVAETAAPWSLIMPVHTATVKAVKERFASEQGGPGYIGCHVSHTYKTGACLYFTYAARQLPGRELPQYYAYKKLVTDTFMREGAALTHHHAVGYEHMPWMKQEIGALGVTTLQALKRTLDPKGILNPGKLIPEADEALLVLDQAPVLVDQAHDSGHPACRRMPGDAGEQAVP